LWKDSARDDIKKQGIFERTDAGMIDFGMTAKDFREKLLEQRPHLLKGALVEPGFSWPDLNALLFLIEPTESLFKLFSDGLVPAENFSREVVELGLQRRRLDKERFYRYIANGATLVLDRLELSSQVARRYSDEISRFTGQTTNGGNGYLTFAGRAGRDTFGKHWDVHDVFAMQFIGRKRWQIYPPTFPLPLIHHTYSVIGDQCPATPAIDCVLEAGDLLYIPRGWWHNVIPLEEASFHLSVGVFAPTVIDYVMWSCNRYLQSQPASRKGLGAGATSREDIVKTMQLASAAVLNPAHLAEFMKAVAERLHQPAVEVDLGLFADPRGAHLSSNETVSLNKRCELDASRAEVALDGVRLKPDQLGWLLLKALSTSGPLTLAALCQRAAPHAGDAIRSAAVDLAKRDVVFIGTRH
jgi:ribosomal protein L16 Arg81 hydroxylase